MNDKQSWADPVDHYDATGSGELYAKLPVRQQSRVAPAGLSEIGLNYSVSIVDDQ